MNQEILTIGHSTHSLETLVRLLVQHGVTAVADVRSHPYSRLNAQFNRETFRDALRSARIAYAFLGRELGARPADPTCYRDGKVDYQLLAQATLFQQGLARVVKGAGQYRLALLCAEKDPLICHRAILVCRHLAQDGLRIQHILADGTTEDHDTAMTRLLIELDLSEDHMFRSRSELISTAYRLRETQIAYTAPLAKRLHQNSGTR